MRNLNTKEFRRKENRKRQTVLPQFYLRINTVILPFDWFSAAVKHRHCVQYVENMSWPKKRNAPSSCWQKHNVAETMVCHVCAGGGHLLPSEHQSENVNHLDSGSCSGSSARDLIFVTAKSVFNNPSIYHLNHHHPSLISTMSARLHHHHLHKMFLIISLRKHCLGILS